MKIHTYYNGLVFRNSTRTNPYKSLWGKKNTFYVYYCVNGECLHRIYRTWQYCPYCGKKIEWEGEKHDV